MTQTDAPFVQLEDDREELLQPPVQALPATGKQDRRGRRRLSLPIGLGIFVPALALGSALAPGGSPARALQVGAAVVLLALLVMRTPKAHPPGENAAEPADLSLAHSSSFARWRLLSFALAFGFLLVTLSIRLPLVCAVDARLAHAFNRCGGPIVSRLLRYVSNAGGGDLMRYWLPLTILGLCVSGRARSLRFLLPAMLGTVGLQLFFKTLIHRPRPHALDLQCDSFPSGHVLSATVLAGALLIILLPACRYAWQCRLLGCAAVGWPVLMSVARVYLGCHYPTDVSGSLLLGAAWIACCRLIGS